MALFDLPLEELKTYMPDVLEPSDFDAFWKRTLEETRQHDLNAEFVPVDYGLALVDIFDVTYSGYGGQRIKGWLILPRERSAPLPCVVEYIGYGGGRGFGYEWLSWATAGYAHFVMDTRGQGSSWRHGDTPDIVDGANPSYPGFMTQGIVSPDSYYYRRVFSDAVRAVEAARSHEAVDVYRVAVTGGSQGGGISIAVSGLVNNLSAVLPEVPFLCHYQRATTIVDTHPYAEIAKYLVSHRDHVETVYNTLSYFDGVNFASRAKAPALYSTALMDFTCPPSTVFAAYNRLQTEKDIKVYPFNGHEGGGAHHHLVKMNFLRDVWA
ncbi:MAG: acetylxylan esterase [Aggregatilineales bacterium]